VAKIKILFLVALSFFLFAAGYRLLAVPPAHAQISAGIDGASIQGVPGLPAAFRASGVVGRTFYLLDGDGVQHTYDVPIPGTERVIASDPGYINVLLENGDLLKFTGTDWALIGNLLGGATATSTETWGRLKARYK